MFCVNCGKQIPDGSKFCPHCGEDLKDKIFLKRNNTSGNNIEEDPIAHHISSGPAKKAANGEELLNSEVKNDPKGEKYEQVQGSAKQLGSYNVSSPRKPVIAVIAVLIIALIGGSIFYFKKDKAPSSVENYDLYQIVDLPMEEALKQLGFDLDSEKNKNVEGIASYGSDLFELDFINYIDEELQSIWISDFNSQFQFKGLHIGDEYEAGEKIEGFDIVAVIGNRSMYWDIGHKDYSLTLKTDEETGKVLIDIMYMYMGEEEIRQMCEDFGSYNAKETEEEIAIDDSRMEEQKEETIVNDSQAGAPTSIPWKNLYSELIEQERKKSALLDKDDSSCFKQYWLYDIDKDDIPELLIEYGTSEAEYHGSCYTVQNDEIILVAEDILLGHTSIYPDPYENGILFVREHMGYQSIQYACLENGELTYSTIYEKDYEDTEYAKISDLVPDAYYLEGYRSGTTLPVDLYETIIQEEVGRSSSQNPPSFPENDKKYYEKVYKNNGKIIACSMDDFMNSPGDCTFNYLLEPGVIYDYASVEMKTSSAIYADLNKDGQMEAVLYIEEAKEGYSSKYRVILNAQDGNVYAYLSFSPIEAIITDDGVFIPSYLGLDCAERVLFDKTDAFEYSIPTDTSYIIPYSDKVLIQPDELYILSERELWLARNEILARHGRIFTNEELNDYFEEQYWYEGTVYPDVFDKKMENILSDVELQNINIIKSEEEKRSREE